MNAKKLKEVETASNISKSTASLSHDPTMG